MALSQWLHANKAATNTTMKRTLTRSGRQDTTIHSYAFPLIAQDVSAKLIVNVSNYFACRKSKPHSRNEARRRRVGVAGEALIDELRVRKIAFSELHALDDERNLGRTVADGDAEVSATSPRIQSCPCTQLDYY